MLTMKTANSVLEIDPACGGALRGWTRNGAPIMHPVVDPKLVEQRGRAVAAYPLIPFSNRVGFGRFSFGGEPFQLDANFVGEPHTIHGNAWMREWTVASHDDMRTLLTLEHQPPGDPAGQWPFRYAAQLEYAFRDDGLSVRIEVRNTDDREQPVGLGFHPFFPRTDELELGFSADSVWIVGQDSLPEQRLAPEAGSPYRFQPMRRLDDTPLDNCFAGWTRQAYLRWPSRGLSLSIRAEEPFDHLVVFTPPGRDYMAVEPASNMTDAINHPEIDDRGLTMLQPGKTLSTRVDFALMGL